MLKDSYLGTEERVNSLLIVVDNKLDFLQYTHLLVTLSIKLAQETLKPGENPHVRSALAVFRSRVQTIGNRGLAHLNGSKEDFLAVALGLKSAVFQEVATLAQKLSRMASFNESRADIIRRLTQSSDWIDYYQYFFTLLSTSGDPNSYEHAHTLASIASTYANSDTAQLTPAPYVVNRDHSLISRTVLDTLGSPTSATIGLEFTLPAELSSSDLLAIGNGRHSFFSGTKRWILPQLPAAVSTYLGPTEATQPTDLDHSDIAPQTRHVQVNAIIDGEPSEAYCRVIEVQNRVPWITESGEAITQSLQSMTLSPFDPNDRGPAINRSISETLVTKPTIAQELLGKEDFSPEDIAQLLLSAGIDPNRNEQSTIEQTTALILASLQGTNSDPILRKFVDKLKNEEPILLLERLYTDSKKYRMGMLLATMVEVAIYGFLKGMDVWIIQCDEGFTQVLQGLFGSDSFCQLGSITQLKKGRKEGVQSDTCNTMALDIGAALRYLSSAMPELATYVINMVANQNPKLGNELSLYASSAES